MIDTYTTKTKAELDQFALSLLEASTDIPIGYDEEGDPPSMVVVVKNGGQTITCGSFDSMRRNVVKLELPLDSFCRQFPTEVAEIVSAMKGDARLIRNSPLFQFLEQKSGFTLAELAPRVVDSILVWHEVYGLEPTIVKRKMSVTTMEMIE